MIDRRLRTRSWWNRKVKKKDEARVTIIVASKNLSGCIPVFVTVLASRSCRRNGCNTGLNSDDRIVRRLSLRRMWVGRAYRTTERSEGEDMCT